MSRKELKDVAKGVLGSFISRNNDVEGYWALGQLRSACEGHDTSTLSLDLVEGTASMDGGVAARVATAYRHILSRHLKRLELGPEHLRSASVLLDFTPPASTRVDTYASYGSPFLCVLQLEDDRGHVYRVPYAGRCAAHNPHEERRSNRA